MTPTFDGPKRRQDAIDKLRGSLPESSPPVWVILLTSPEDAAYEAAVVSATEKVKAFREANVQVEFINDDNWRLFAPSSIKEVLASSTLKIVQQPLPREISSLPIKNDLDIDLSNGRSLPAVCEAVDLALSELGGWWSKRPIAVIGAKGFIGKYMVSMLEGHGCTVIPIDRGDSLTALSEAEFVISAASTAGCLTEEHITESHVILDLGFEKTGSKSWGGNLTAGAAKKARYATPVPRGMGPAQMAILIERYINAVRVSTEQE